MIGNVPFPNTLNQTQSVRFGQQVNQSSNMVPSIANYNTNGPLTTSTQQSGMSSTTQPNAHLILQEGQGHFINTATIPQIKNAADGSAVDPMASAYASNT